MTPEKFESLYTKPLNEIEAAKKVMEDWRSYMKMATNLRSIDKSSQLFKDNEKFYKRMYWEAYNYHEKLIKEFYSENI